MKEAISIKREQRMSFYSANLEQEQTNIVISLEHTLLPLRHSTQDMVLIENFP